MRILRFGLLALALIQSASHHSVEAERAIPVFMLHNGEWICVDRNPQQLRRQDCWPRGAQKSSGSPN